MSDGDDARDDGIEQTLAAEAEEWKEAWRSLAWQMFDALPTGGVFTGEMLRIHAEQSGLDQPHHSNCWSGMTAGFFRTLHGDALIIREGWAKAISRSSHSHWYRSYRKIA